MTESISVHNLFANEQQTLDGQQIYDSLIDIRTCKRKEKASRTENATFLLEQIRNHTRFKVGNDVVEISFKNTEKSLTEVLSNHFKGQIGKGG